MKTSTGKWLYTFLLLLITMAWAVYLVEAVREAIKTPTAINIIEVSGVSVLLGALIAWNGNVNQHWFRKKIADETSNPN